MPWILFLFSLLWMPQFLVATGSPYVRSPSSSVNKNYDFPPSTKQTLTPRAYIPLPVGSITPKGWLLTQLKLQAEGLSGHLSMFWNDVMNSVWIGGKGDGGLHERAPYWLNGFLPLAYLLKNAGIEELPGMSGIYKQTKEPRHNSATCKNGTDMPNYDISDFNVQSDQECFERCNATDACVGWVVNDCDPKNIHCWLKHSIGATREEGCRCFGQISRPIPPVKPLEQALKYVNYILTHQQSSGWLGPDESGGVAYWARSNVILSLIAYAEANRDNKALYANVTSAVLKYSLEQKRRMATAKLSSWAAERWIDMALAAQWLLDNAPQGHEQDLWDYGTMLHEQGVNWEQWFENWTGNAGGHNVNNAQGLKSSAVWYRQSKNETLHTLSKTRIQHLDEELGLPTGMYNGDEILPNPHTRNPSRGIELCAVVEAMFSYTTMFSVHGDVLFADRAEKIAYNALPATWASPQGGDMWAHQYLQAINEINAIKADPHVWTHDGDMAETYGLEPNYGCCTANFNQGWPKFANMVIMSSKDGGGVVAILAPASAKLPNGATIDIETSYPYDDVVTISCSSVAKTMPLYIRVPHWSTGATINNQPVANGTMVKETCPAGKTTTFILHLHPTIRVETWGDSPAITYSILRGPLLYSLPIGAKYTVYGHHWGTGANASNDYYLEPTTPWNYAIDLDPQNPDKTLVVTQPGYKPGTAPFNHTGWPILIAATVRQVPEWKEYQNSAAAPPASPACTKVNANCGQPVKVQLVPHGGTELRIGEWPLTGF